MTWHVRLGVSIVLATAVLLVSSPVLGQTKERTSENTPFLKKLLEGRPESDLDKDGILTLEEA